MPLTLYSYDEDGVFVGEFSAAESPLEPGVYLWPARSTDKAPPAVEAGKAPVWGGSAWVSAPDHRGETWYAADGSAVEILSIGDPAAHGLSASPPPPTAAELKARAAALRWGIESGGVDFGGRPIATDRETQSKIAAAVLSTLVDPAFAIPAWKYPDGSFAALDADGIRAMAGAISAHVSAAFELEAQVAGEIDAGTITTLAQVEAAFAAGE